MSGLCAQNRRAPSQLSLLMPQLPATCLHVTCPGSFGEWHGLHGEVSNRLCAFCAFHLRQRCHPAARLFT
jgi:hypothetical protein